MRCRTIHARRDAARTRPGGRDALAAPRDARFVCSRCSRTARQYVLPKAAVRAGEKMLVWYVPSTLRASGLRIRYAYRTALAFTAGYGRT